jgi:F-type H+-transporting ATPase subunit delta
MRPRGAKSQNGRVAVSSAVSLTSGVAGRYATALFEIAREGKALDKVEADLDAVRAALAESADLREMIASPVHTRDEQGRAIGAIAGRMGLGSEVANTLGLLAQHRRLFVLPRVIDQVKALIADERGEVTAEVTSARPLSDAQTAALAEKLKANVGRDVSLNVTVDERLIGGLVVKVGSQMIDTSIRAKLGALQSVMKEAG